MSEVEARGCTDWYPVNQAIPVPIKVLAGGRPGRSNVVLACVPLPKSLAESGRISLREIWNAESSFRMTKDHYCA